MKGLLPIGSASCGHTVSYHAGRRSASLRFGRKDKICIFVLFRAGTFRYNEVAARKADTVCHEGSFIESALRGFFMEDPPTMQNSLSTTKKMTTAAACMAIGLLLPFITGHIQVIGQMLSPMHLPIFICGMLCGWKWGAAAGAVTPLLRHFLFQMPPMPGALFIIDAERRPERTVFRHDSAVPDLRDAVRPRRIRHRPLSVFRISRNDFHLLHVACGGVCRHLARHAPAADPDPSAGPEIVADA